MLELYHAQDSTPQEGKAIDVLIEPTPENARRAHSAIRAWGGFEPVYTPEDFISGDILSFGGLLRVEIHSQVPGAAWRSVWENRVPGELLGVPTFFAGLDDRYHGALVCHSLAALA